MDWVPEWIINFSELFLNEKRMPTDEEMNQLTKTFQSMSFGEMTTAFESLVRGLITSGLIAEEYEEQLGC